MYEGTPTLADLFGEIKTDAVRVARTYQSMSNDWAALEAQNDDIRNGRWTLNNAVYQFNQLTPMGQLVLGVGALLLLAHFID